MASAERLLPNETGAEFCRRMGWREGDRIESPTEGAHSVLELVELADFLVRAREVSRNGRPLKTPQVHTWALGYRPWRKAQ